MRTFVRKMMRYFLWLQHFVHDLDLTLHCLLKVAKFSSGMINKSMRRAAVAEGTKAPLSRTVFVGHSSGLHLVSVIIRYLSLFIKFQLVTQITNPLCGIESPELKGKEVFVS